MAAPPTRPPPRRKKLSYCTANPITHIHYKHTQLLKPFISQPRKILPPPLTPTSPKYQPIFTPPIKPPPHIPLLPYLKE
ncbi:30S ribosomal protein S18, partial [Staphylococcus pasteuri]|uniref:30S ribosomal protein S18 n=1 Tax=Staphylococcus pasteuri TaxID=45972 RepID=UPI0012B77991